MCYSQQALTQHIRHTDLQLLSFHPRLPVCSPNTPLVIEEMNLCCTKVSLLVKLALKVRGSGVATVGTVLFCNIFHNMTKGILPNSLWLTEWYFTVRWGPLFCCLSWGCVRSASRPHWKSALSTFRALVKRRQTTRRLWGFSWRSCLGAICVSFKRSETQRVKQYRPWLRSSTGTSICRSLNFLRFGVIVCDCCFCLQIWQIQLLLLCGKWAAGEEHLQGTVCLHIQVNHCAYPTWLFTVSGEFKVLPSLSSVFLQEQHVDGQRALSVSQTRGRNKWNWCFLQRAFYHPPPLAHNT